MLLGKYWDRLFNTSFGTALIIGNGESRKSINLEELSKKYNATFGCNILYRDFYPTYLATKNNGIFEDYLKEGIWKKSIIIHKTHSEENYPERRFYHFVGKFGHCGLIILHLAIKMGFKIIDLIGFDMDFSNIYHGRSKYYGATTTPNYIWKERKDEMGQIIENHPEIKFNKYKYEDSSHNTNPTRMPI